MGLMKRVIIIFVLLFCVLGVSGCMNIFSGKSAYERMETYLEDKYGEKFTFLEAQGSYKISGSSTRCATFSSEKFPKAKDLYVYAREDDKGEYKFTDNYLKYLLGDEVEEYIANLVEPIYGKCKVFMLPDQQTLSDDYGADTTVKEMVSAGNLELAIFLNSDANFSTKDKDIEMLKSKLKENQIMTSLCLFYMNEPHYEAVDDENINTYYIDLDPKKDNRYKTVGLFFNNRSYEFYQNEWR